MEVTQLHNIIELFQLPNKINHYVPEVDLLALGFYLFCFSTEEKKLGMQGTCNAPMKGNVTCGKPVHIQDLELVEL